MNITGSFIFNSKRVAFSEIERWTNPLNEFEGKILTFAREWLSKKQEFTVQTSGSTGSPKPIVLTRNQITASAKLTKDYFNLKAGQNALLCLDPDFIAGKMMIVRALEVGMNLICAPPTANPLEKISIDSSISFAAFVPYQLEAILNHPGSLVQLAKIEKVIVGGAKVSSSAIDKIQTQPTQFFETYGMTETITHVAIRKLNPVESLFIALPGITFSIDKRSCLAIHANHLGSKPIITNDVVELASATSFSLMGRVDNIINTAGVKISPEEVERKISTVMANNWDGCEYFIAGVKDKLFGEISVLFVESKPVDDGLTGLIIELMKPQLKKWEIPKKIVCIPAFKRTSSGKVNRAESVLSAIAP